MERGRLKTVLAGCGCATLVGALLISGIVFGLPMVRDWNIQVPQIVQTLPASAPFGSGTAIATPSLMQTTISPAPVGTSIIPSTGDMAQNQEIVSSDFLSKLYETVSPGVVSIDVLISDQGQTGQAAGSGFVFDDAGHIVTNNHVVENSTLVIVTFQDGSELKAEVIGTDPYSDLAVVKVDQLPESATPLPLGDSSQTVTGDWVVAIGNPFGLNSSMSLGIVSAMGRTIPVSNSFTIPEIIQTDAAINPGNSGGPLLNMQGQVIGVNAQIASGGAMANAGVGFSIPSNTVRRVIPSLIQVGSFQWAWLGIEGTDMNIFMAQANNVDSERGAYIVHIIPGGPADQAGLRGGDTLSNVDGVDVPTGGDIITAVNGETIEDYTELLSLIASNAPGTTLELTILRDGQEQKVNVTLGPRPTN